MIVDGQSIKLALGDPDHPVGTLVITQRTAGIVNELEYQSCAIGPVFKHTGAVQIFDDESDLIENFQNSDQTPIVLLRHPSEYSPNVFLLEDVRYYLEFSSESGQISEPLSALQNLAEIERVPTQDKLYAVRFASYAGRSVFDVTVDGVRYEVPFEVRCTKIEYIKEYPLMLSQISEFLSGLLLDSNSPLSERYRLGDRQSTTYYEDFILIEYLFNKLDLCGLFGYICNNIHRELIAERECSYDCAAYNVDPDSIQDLIAKGSIFPRNGGNICGRFEFSKMINIRFEDTFDTPENRLIKDFLLILLDMLDGISSCNIEGYVRCSVIEKKEMVQSMLSEWWLKDVGKLQYIPFESNILNASYGYADIFNMYLMLGLNLEFKVDDARFLFEGHTNKVSQTYEYWCYIKLFEALCELSGETKAYKMELQKRWGLSIRGGSPIEFLLPDDGGVLEVKLYYNQGTRKGHSIESYSVPLRPDFTLVINGCGNTKIVNFDSKYKLQKIELSDCEDDDLLTTICWRADIYKMHTYKDAIYHCWGSYVLYPGEKRDWFTKKMSEDWKDKKIPSVGAIPLSPLSKDIQEFTNIVGSIIKSVTEIDYTEMSVDQVF